MSDGGSEKERTEADPADRPDQGDVAETAPHDGSAVSTDDATELERAEAEHAELERVRAERDELAAKLSDERKVKRSRLRQVFAGICVALSILLFTVSVPGAWARRTLLSTDGYVSTVAPLGSNPAVDKALSVEITNQVFAAVPIEQQISQALPPKAVFLAGPLTSAIKGFVLDQVNKVLASPTFDTLWTEANRFAHAQLISILNGGSTVVSTVNGKVVLNVLPLINQALAAIQGQASQLLGKNVQLPQITQGELPQAARDQIQSALGITLPQDFGQIVVFRSDTLQTAQTAVSLFNKVLWGSIIGWILFFVVAMLLSQRRRRTLIQLMVGFLLGMVIIRNVARIYESGAVNKITDPVNRAAARAASQRLLGSLLSYTLWFLLIAFVVLAIALITGPYPWALRFRGWVRHAWGVVTEALSGRAQDPALGTWVAAHRDALRIGGAVVAVLLLLVLHPGWLSFLIVIGLLAVWELVVTRIAHLRQTGSAEEGPPDGGAVAAETTKP